MRITRFSRLYYESASLSYTIKFVYYCQLSSSSSESRISYCFVANFATIGATAINAIGKTINKILDRSFTANWSNTSAFSSRGFGAASSFEIPDKPVIHYSDRYPTTWYLLFALFDALFDALSDTQLAG